MNPSSSYKHDNTNNKDDNSKVLHKISSTNPLYIESGGGAEESKRRSIRLSLEGDDANNVHQHRKSLTDPNIASIRKSLDLSHADDGRKHLRNTALERRSMSFVYTVVDKPTPATNGIIEQSHLSVAISSLYGAPQFSSEYLIYIYIYVVSMLYCLSIVVRNCNICDLYFVQLLIIFNVHIVLSLYMLMSVHITPYYETIGASLSYLAFFTAFARSWDCLTDPFMGYITDSTKSRYGRRKPYIFIGAPLFAIFSIFLLSPGFIAPSLKSSSTAAAWWFGIFNLCFYLSDSLTHIPYNALG